jgi:hypothetical protein
MNRFHQLLIVAAVAVALTGLSACEKKEGPAERAGEHIDKAADDLRDAGKDAGKKMGEAMENTGEKMQGK